MDLADADSVVLHIGRYTTTSSLMMTLNTMDAMETIPYRRSTRVLEGLSSAADNGISSSGTIITPVTIRGGAIGASTTAPSSSSTLIARASTGVTVAAQTIAKERIRDFLRGHLTSGEASSNDASSDNEDRQREVAGSPPPNCAICLGKVNSKCFTDSCMHQFCFSCLVQWSKIKAECPLCKQSFKSIIHNVRSMDDYEEHKVEPQSAAQRCDADMRSFADELQHIIVVSRHHHHRLPSALPMRLTTTSSGYPNNPLRFFELFQNESPLTDRYARENADDTIPPRSSGTVWRSYVYRNKLYAMPLLDVTGRSRNISAEFLRTNPAQLHRLMPWLNREILWRMRLDDNVSYVITMISHFCVTYDMTSIQFRSHIRQYFAEYAEHFVHELANFARSQYDMIGYDRYVQYQPYFEENPANMSREPDLVVSRTRMDLDLLNLTQPRASTSSSSSVVAMEDAAVRLAERARLTPAALTMSPVAVASTSAAGAGPSTSAGAGAGAGPVTIASVVLDDTDSSSDDVQFVREQKPPHLRTPIMVELNSDSDSDVQFVQELLPVKLEAPPAVDHPALPTKAGAIDYSSSAEDELDGLNIQPTVAIQVAKRRVTKRKSAARRTRELCATRSEVLAAKSDSLAAQMLSYEIDDSGDSLRGSIEPQSPPNSALPMPSDGPATTASHEPSVPSVPSSTYTSSSESSESSDSDSSASLSPTVDMSPASSVNWAQRNDSDDSSGDDNDSVNDDEHGCSDEPRDATTTHMPMMDAGRSDQFANLKSDEEEDESTDDDAEDDDDDADDADDDDDDDAVDDAEVDADDENDDVTGPVDGISERMDDDTSSSGESSHEEFNVRGVRSMLAMKRRTAAVAEHTAVQPTRRHGRRLRTPPQSPTMPSRLQSKRSRQAIEAADESDDDDDDDDSAVAAASMLELRNNSTSSVGSNRSSSGSGCIATSSRASSRRSGQHNKMPGSVKSSVWMTIADGTDNDSD